MPMYARTISTLRRGVLASLVAMLALLGPASAQQPAIDLPFYDVEIVIFRQLSTDATEEVWGVELSKGEGLTIPQEDASPFEAPSSATNDTRAAKPFPALPSSRMKLTAIEEQLRRSRNYRPLAHFGWTQPGFTRNAAPFVPIGTFVPASAGVTGQIALSRGRYLHLTLDLVFTPQDGTGERFVLRQSRRMRSNERHYIDHPKFGVIAVITPSGS